MKLELFFSRGLPLGVHSISRRFLIDVDEFRISLDRCNNKFGWAAKNFRVRKSGHYVKDTKLTVLFGIEPGDPDIPNGILGSVSNTRRWIRVIQSAGTTAVVFAVFIDSICVDIENNGLHHLGYNSDNMRGFI